MNWTKASLKLYHADCMDVMRHFPDGYFDLAVVDPQYGIGADKKNAHSCIRDSEGWADKDWDDKPPSAEYFAELKRVSVNRIIWGGNYFLDHLGSTQCLLIWNKPERNFSLADAEVAWTSFQSSIRCFDHPRNEGARIHPTQKPVALYRWLLAKYAKPGQRILDTHLGSGSHAIAAHYAGMDFTGIELDADYFAAACERIERETAQGDMFTPPASLPVLMQPNLELS
jgi:site-specific DNA-methyltransferase (adenine-specific)